MQSIPNQDAPLPPRLTTTAQRPRLKSEELFRCGHEVIIEHHGEEYRLRLTRNDKIILNK